MTPEHKALVAAKADILEWMKSYPDTGLAASYEVVRQIDAAIESLSAQGKADAEPMIPRAENCGRYLAEVNDGRLLYLNHANTWQECPNFITHPAPAPVPDAVDGDLETQAWNCDKWPDWLHTIVDKTNEVADRLDMSSEQAHAYAVLSALASKMPVEDGYVPVPKEPTREILDAIVRECKVAWGVRADIKCMPANRPSEWREVAKPFYRAMLAASGEPSR